MSEKRISCSEELRVWLASIPEQYRDLYYELRGMCGKGANYFPMFETIRMVEQQMEVDKRRAARKLEAANV